MLLGNLLSKNDKPVKIETKQAGIWVLQASGCPSVLIECGYLSNNADLQHFKSSDHQKAVAKNIIAGIEQYFEMKENGKLEAAVNDIKNINEFSGTIATAEPVAVQGYPLKNKEKIVKGKKLHNAKPINEVTIIGFGKKNDAPMNEVVVTGYANELQPTNEVTVVGYAAKRNSKANERTVTGYPTKKINEVSLDEGAIFLNGKKITKAELQNLPLVKIQSVTNLKPENAIKKYGEDGRSGVIDIVTVN